MTDSKKPLKTGKLRKEPRKRRNCKSGKQSKIKNKPQISNKLQRKKLIGGSRLHYVGRV